MVVGSDFDEKMSSFGESDENLSSYINKRCQVRQSGERGLVTDVIRGGRSDQLQVELDEEGTTYVTYVSKLYIADENNKYLPYERSSQRDNSFKRHKQVPTTAAIPAVAVQRGRNEAEASNNDPISTGTTSGSTASRNSIRRNNTGTKRRRADSDEDNHSESEDSDSNSEVEDLGAVSTDGWTIVENVFGKLNTDSPCYRGEDTILKWNSAGITFTPGDVKLPIDYFRFMFPVNITNRVVAATNVGISIEDHISANDFWKYIGIRMAFVLQPIPFGIKDGAFGQGIIEETLFEKGEYGRKYGMSRNRFMFIDAKLKFIQFTADEKRQVSLVLCIQQLCKSLPFV